MIRSRPGRIAVIVGLAVVVLGLLDAKFLLIRASAGRQVGIAIEPAAGGIDIVEVFAGGPADRAGLRVGDRLVALNGAPIHSEADYDRVAHNFQRGHDATFTVVRDERPTTLVVRPGMSPAWLPGLGDSLVALCYLALAALALHQREHDLRATLLFLFSLSVAVELALPPAPIGNVAVQIASNAGYFLLTGVQFGLFIHLAAVTPRRARWLERHGRLVLAFYVLGLGVALVVLASFLAPFRGVPPLPWNAERAVWLFDTVGLAVWALLVLGILTGQTLRVRDPLVRHQALLVLGGATPWAAFMIVSGTLTVAGVEIPDAAMLLQQPFLLCFPVAVFVAIFRYRLFDLEAIVRRSMVYTALTGTLVLLFYAVVGAGSALFSQWLEGGASVVVVAGATLLLGLLFSPLRNALQRAIDRRFFPERHAQRKRLVALAGELPALGKVPAMGAYLVEQLTAIFALGGATLLVADPSSRVLLMAASSGRNPDRDLGRSLLLAADDPGIETLRRGRRPAPAEQVARSSAALAQRLQPLGAALVVPIIQQEELIGLLVLGAKDGGERYRAEEVELLTLLAHHVASVLENARLFESATVDGLTGLLRREVAIDRLHSELKRASRYRRALSVGMADLDTFKAVNDRHGHLVGDALLQVVARAMRAGLRSTDFIGRYGGEEFIIVLPETTSEGATKVAEKVRATVEGSRLPLEDGSSIGVTVSIGIATFIPGSPNEEPAKAGELIAEADRRLLQAKAGGRNRIEPEIGEEVVG